MTYVYIALGAIAGALCRYHAVRTIQAQFNHAFPWATWIVNLSGSFLLGILGGVLRNHPTWPTGTIQSILGVGFCGTYTTFSAFIFETIQLWRHGNWRACVVNICSQPLLGLLLAWLGLLLGEHL